MESVLGVLSVLAFWGSDLESLSGVLSVLALSVLNSESVSPVLSVLANSWRDSMMDRKRCGVLGAWSLEDGWERGQVGGQRSAR